MELTLLRCWLRNCNPAVISQQINDFDFAVDESLDRIIGKPLTGTNRVIASLPLSMGGLGILVASNVADSAFVSSVGSS